MSTSERQKLDVNVVLAEFERFLQDIELTDELSGGWHSEPFKLLTRGEVTVILTGSEAESFTNIVEKLHTSMTQRGRAISKAAVSRLASDCIADIAKRNQQRDTPEFNLSLQQLISDLKAKLFAPERRWRFLIPVGGLAPSGLPFQVGGIHFRFGDGPTLAEIVKEAESFANNQPAFSMTKAGGDVDQFEGAAIATVEAQAVDSEAARQIARSTLRGTLDCLNFYAGRWKWRMWAYLYGECDSKAEPTLAFQFSPDGKREGWSAGAITCGPIRNFPLNQLSKLPGFSRMSEILQKPERYGAEERFVRSMQWVGRAEVDPRPEEAFLLYAISLESLLLGSKNLSEIGYRLRVRCAQLVSPPERRRDTASHVDELYRLRSAIVHRGSVQVPESDLALMRRYCRAAVGRVLNDPVFLKMKSEEEFDDWFERQSLGLPA